ncbi:MULTISPECIES: ClC family H(+)/Cl(-) exchange transporter [Helcococcus]|uniref:ClC family H(+)/Cl(-) exchange transporter n=1 Tax=Helcococcus bovis TaxID=3153252 RepID=A0ABW9F775_9FIRM
MIFKENDKIRFLIAGSIIGMICGFMLTIYRLLVVLLQGKMQILYTFARENLLNSIIILLFLAFLGFLVGMLTYKEPMIGGSGIPQVMGQIKGLLTIKWQKVLPFKFLGGVIGLASGLTLGREGPSVQMGASIGQAYAELGKSKDEDSKILISAGAAAGLSAAFNAPISGILFALEELHHSFNKYVFIAVTSSSIFANYISGLILGVEPVINLGKMSRLSPSLYTYLILMGLIIGLLAPIFTLSIYKLKDLYDSMPLPKYIQVIIPFVLTGIAIILFPHAFGSGEHFIFLPIEHNADEFRIFEILFAKFILLIIAFSSGMPGGIFLPMLVLGSLIGNAFGQSLVMLGIIESNYIVLFSSIAMAANFAAIVRSPLTGIILLLELTGSFTFFLPISVVVLTSYMVVELMNLKPIYSGLLKKMYAKINN